ncbi:ATP-grasp domain-containing protein [Halovulum dunhuangense]|uniref:ATP-grasp domain-containing protein n=1 Tax=Halovulum dunhuangense TaxID=1505036 RepID=A0A849L5B4_9RHOB|nr:biotin carboxylase N-terminal domain-containing protein [Halovulum dunhuangense]NNU81453.1 ATP-grasp domain-containing protein [Halovulum dunhuangense]
MFRKLLIANRGEIACRIIRTARRMGIATVAVHSDADAGALHVAMADEAVRIGPAPVRQSYLDGEAILRAARASGAEAIHPGYGFLSENPDFVDAVEAAGLVFVGPSAAAIRAMGLKDRAKALMAEAGVPVVPGYHGARQEPDFLAGCAEEIGYPVLIKAVAGGGGKGMRRVAVPQDFAEALEGARREALAAFGNGDVLIEKWIDTPRHIEVQVFGDGRAAIHLFERDCSLQRRHQKVIEEAPAPGMTAELRAAMGAAAVRAARAIGYAGAGTVEFIADGAGPLRADGFWFMEMNTRLQVEHPVTEAVTGIDLVEWQLRVAFGEPLPLAQEDLRLSGHAIEARVYAEDPANGFLPATGHLSHVDFDGGLRVEAGVRAGDAITPHYDPMIAKLIATGPDRAAAMAALRRGLARSVVAGSVTNMGFLGRLLAHPDFAAGRIDTGLIERDAVALTAPPVPLGDSWALAALAACDLPRAGATGFHLWVPLPLPVTLEWQGKRVDLTLRQPAPDAFEVDTPEGRVRLSDVRRDGEVWHHGRDGHRRRTWVAPGPDRVTLAQDGEALIFGRPDPLAAGLEERGADVLRAPMPGLVTQMRASPGARVAQGDLLVVLEAMKMEHVLRAPRDGVIADVTVTEGAQVAQDAVLLRLEVADD